MGWGVVGMVLTMAALAMAWEFISPTGELSLEGARALAVRKELVLNLDGVTSLTPGVAGALSKQQGWLFLNGLKTLSPKAADVLARHEGYRWLLPPWR